MLAVAALGAVSFGAGRPFGAARKSAAATRSATALAAAEARLGAAALRALPAPLVAALAAEAEAHTRAGEDTARAAAADFRAGRTVTLEGVLLSRAEAARAVAAALAARAARARVVEGSA
jgi:hypothetical protein